MPHTTRAIVIALTTFAGVASAQEISGAWKNDCASCHGAKLDGGSTPDGKKVDSLLDNNWLVTDGSDRALFDIIKNGSAKVPGHDFSGEQHPDRQVWSMVVHMREVRARATNKNSKAVDGVYATKLASFTLEDIVPGGVETPWSVDFIPSATPKGLEKLADAMLMTERGGAVRVVTKNVDGSWTMGTPIEATPESTESGQGGMMDVAVHPDFATNGWIYLSFAKKGEGAARRTPTMTTIVRGKLEEGDGTWRWVNQETIFEAPQDKFIASGVHFGCRIVFDPPAYSDKKADKRYVFWSIGERGQGAHAQDLTRPNGKVHRLFDDGALPTDNPFADAASKDKGIDQSIWTYGNRNPQGLAFDLNGNLIETEHAPRGGDEINIVKKGANYGWPLVSFGIEYSGMPRTTPWPDVQGVSEEIEMPVDIWLPSIAACGLDVVRPGPKGEAFPAWKGDMLAGGLAGQCVDRLRIVDGKIVERENVLRGVGRIRDVVTAPDGSVYLVLNGPDKVVRMAPAKK